MASEFRTERRVEFAETDCAGIVHFAEFFRYMEEAEHAFLRSLGLSVHERLGEDEVIGFPRLSSRCDFRRPLRFEDVVDIHLWVSRKRTRTLEYSFVFSLGGEEVARGQTVTVACRIQKGRPQGAVALPERFDRALEEATLPPLEFYSPEPGEEQGDPS